MRKRSNRLGLAQEAGAPFTIPGKMFGQYLDGDVAVQAEVPGTIDFAHASGINRRKDQVTAKLPAHERSRRLDGGSSSFDLNGRYLHEAFRFAVGLEQRLHFIPKIFIAATRIHHERGARVFIAFEGSAVNPFDRLPSFSVHALPRRSIRAAARPWPCANR